MSFSQRIGKKPYKTIIQVDSMDNDLRVGLWNVLHLIYIVRLRKTTRLSQSPEADLFRGLWFNFFKLPLDEIPWETVELVKFLKKRFLKEILGYLGKGGPGSRRHRPIGYSAKEPPVPPRKPREVRWLGF